MSDIVERLRRAVAESGSMHEWARLCQIAADTIEAERALADDAADLFERGAAAGIVAPVDWQDEAIQWMARYREARRR